MIRKSHLRTLSAGLVLACGLSFTSVAADHDKVIEQVMKDYHKAPKGVDPICKKAVDGTATPEELKKLIAGYKAMAKTKPPQGDAASWKEKNAKLVSTSEALLKGGADARASYKEAVNCKACHSAHKPDDKH